MRLSYLLIGSVGFTGAVSAQAQLGQGELVPMVLELRLDGRRAEGLAWRDARGEIHVERATLETLSIRAPNAADPIPLTGVPGLSFALEEADSALTIICTAQCFEAQLLTVMPDHTPVVDHGSGGFFNADLAATRQTDESSVSGLFELGLFSRNGYGGAGFVAESQRGDVLRLETHWTFDFLERRERLRIGDGIVRGGATGVPFRFGGIQYGSDFALDPGFIPFPTPTLRGEAATPSIVDLYVDGALRMREGVDAGPFSITNTPLVTGGGVAQIVVTDALGRQQVYAQAFYASPTMLHPGLAEHSITLGVEREHFTLQSDDYGRGFATALYRRGFSDSLTAEIRAEAADGNTGIGIAASFAHSVLGQIDLATALSRTERNGAFARAGWQRSTRNFSVAVHAEAASAHFVRVGDYQDEPVGRWSAAANLSTDLDRFGTVSLAYTFRDTEANERTETIGLSYAPQTRGRTHLFLNALHVRDERSYLTVSIGLSRQFGDAGHASTRVELYNERLAAHISAQHTPEQSGGFGWRASAQMGQGERYDAAIAHLGTAHEVAAELSVTRRANGVRLQYATALAWIDGETFASRPVRESFALVDVGVPGVTVQRDRRSAGVSNKDGRIIVNGLRPYEENRISIDMNEAPFDTLFEADEVLIIPAARSGAVARLARQDGRAGEVSLTTVAGAPLQRGAILVRVGDGARFPVGADGRVYVTGVAAPQRFHVGDCWVTIAPQNLIRRETIECSSE